MATEFLVKFYNEVSNLLHTEVSVFAEGEKAAVEAAKNAFNKTHAYEPAHTDPDTQAYVEAKGTPGYEASRYRVVATPVVSAESTGVQSMVDRMYPPVSVGGVPQSQVPDKAVDDTVTPQDV